MFEKACFPSRTAGRGETPFETAHASASTSLEGRPADHLVTVPRHGARTAYISADRWRIPPPPRTTSSTRPPPPSAYTHGDGGGVGRAVTLRQTCPRDKPRAQLAFKNSMIRGILQFTLRIAFRCVLHRCESQDIRC